MRDIKLTVLLVFGASFFTGLALVGLVRGGGDTRQAIGHFRRHYSDEGETMEARAARLDRVAGAIDKVTRNRFDRALLLTVAWHESRFAANVQGCEVKGDGGRAIGLWQTHALKCPKQVEEQAEEAIRHLRSAARLCKGNTDEDRARGAMSLYATGRTCRWHGARKRIATFKKVASWL